MIACKFVGLFKILLFITRVAKFLVFTTRITFEFDNSEHVLIQYDLVYWMRLVNRSRKYFLETYYSIK